MRQDPVRRLPHALLIASCAAAAGLVLYLSRGGNFYYDEWIWFSGAVHPSASTLFQSDNGHLVLIPRLIYEGVLSAFGTHYLPFRLINLSLVLTSSVLLFILGRRRVGNWLALAPAVLLLFFGSAWDVLASGGGVGVNLAVACGLGAFIALERRTTASDLLAGGLVMVGLASFSGEVAIALGGIVLLVTQGRWRGIWVMAIPILLFAIWDAQATQVPGTTTVTPEHIGGLSFSMFDSVAAAMAGVTGAFSPSFPSGLAGIDLSVGRSLAAVAIAGLSFLLLSGRQVTPRFFAYATTAVSFWAMIGLVGRDPSLGRYNIVVLPFVFLALFELVAGYTLRRRHWIAVGVVLGFGLLANVVALRDGAAILRYRGAVDRAALAALALQPRRAEASPELRDTPISQLAGFSDPTQSDLIYITPSQYFRAADRFGSAAYPPAQLALAPEYARESADRLLFRVLGVEARPFSPGAAVRRGRRCTTLRPAARGSQIPSIEIPIGGLTVRTAATGARLKLRRFADVSTIAPISVPARSVRALSVPGDSLSRLWTADVSSTAAVIACQEAPNQPARRTR